jgi:hypothetical protein
MPLKKEKKNIGRNIRELEAHGHPYDQSLAISLKEAGVKKAKKKKK